MSKTLIPGARLGWVVVPTPLSRGLCTAKRDSDFGTDVLVQHTFARMLATGDYDRHVRRQRSNYRAKRTALLIGLARHLPDWAVRGAEAGLHLWIQPPEPIDEVGLVGAAENRGLLVLGMGSMCGAVRLPGLALGFARLSSHQGDDVAFLLAEAVRAVQHGRPAVSSGSSAPRSTDLRARLGATGVDFFEDNLWFSADAQRDGADDEPLGGEIYGGRTDDDEGHG